MEFIVYDTNQNPEAASPPTPERADGERWANLSRRRAAVEAWW